MAVTKKEGDGNHPSSHYLVVEDPKKPSTWHLRVKDTSGKPDHTLMGAAWAALHGGYRGNKYEGPNKSAALAKLKALYASEKMPLPAGHIEDDGILVAHFDSKLGGTFPEVPINDGVDLEALSQLDGGDPLFMTLPIAKKGMQTADGFMYTDAFVERLHQQLTSEGVAGNMGHVPASERDSKFPLPSALWIGAMIDQGGMLWGKAYLSDPTFKQFAKQLKVTNSKIATSIYGTYDPSTTIYNKDGSRQIDPTTFKLESLDFAPPARAALQFERTMSLTSHMNKDKETDMEFNELLSQLTVDKVPDELKEAIIAEFKQTQDSEAQLAQMKGQLDAANETVTKLTAALAETHKAGLTAHMEVKLAEIAKVDTEANSLKESIKMAVLSQINADTTQEALDKAIDEYVESPAYKALAQMVVTQMSGGRVSVQAGDKTGNTKSFGEEYEANIETLKAEVGLPF